MDTKLLCRAHRESTDSWLSLVVPDELSSKEQQAIWLADMCGEEFLPDEIQPIPKHLIDELLTLLPMKELEKNDGQDTDDSRRGNGSEN
tara:strand:- start:272 stop:538 length:267 start_codon:yes stop_codon:yes gene_type:complete